MEEMEDEDPLWFICTLCQRALPSFGLLISHKKTRHGGQKSQNVVISKNELSPLLSIPRLNNQQLFSVRSSPSVILNEEHVAASNKSGQNHIILERTHTDRELAISSVQNLSQEESDVSLGWYIKPEPDPEVTEIEDEIKIEDEPADYGNRMIEPMENGWVQFPSSGPQCDERSHNSSLVLETSPTLTPVSKTPKHVTKTRKRTTTPEVVAQLSETPTSVQISNSPHCSVCRKSFRRDDYRLKHETQIHGIIHSKIIQKPKSKNFVENDDEGNDNDSDFECDDDDDHESDDCDYEGENQDQIDSEFTPPSSPHYEPRLQNKRKIHGIIHSKIIQKLKPKNLVEDHEDSDFQREDLDHNESDDREYDGENDDQIDSEITPPPSSRLDFRPRNKRKRSKTFEELQEIRRKCGLVTTTRTLNIQCHSCDAVCDNNVTFASHVLSVHLSDSEEAGRLNRILAPRNITEMIPSQIECYICQRIFETMNSFAFHVMSFHVRTGRKVNGTRVFIFAANNKKIMDKKLLKGKQTHADEVASPIGHDPIGRSKIKRHKNLPISPHINGRIPLEVHEFDEYFVCNVCKEDGIYKTLNELSVHMSTNHKESPADFTCKICQKCCENADSLEMHFHNDHCAVLIVPDGDDPIDSAMIDRLEKRPIIPPRLEKHFNKNYKHNKNRSKDYCVEYFVCNVNSCADGQVENQRQTPVEVQVQTEGESSDRNQISDEDHDQNLDREKTGGHIPEEINVVNHGQVQKQGQYQGGIENHDLIPEENEAQSRERAHIIDESQGQMTDCNQGQTQKQDLILDESQGENKGPCYGIYKTAEELLKHMTSTHQENPDAPVCKVCGKICSTSVGIKWHFRKEHSFMVEAPKDEKGEMEITREIVNRLERLPVLQSFSVRKSYIPCEICGTYLQHEAALEDHMNRHGGTKRYMCSICGKEMTTQKALKYHETAHRNTNKYRCKPCGRGFNNRRKYEEHVARKHSTTRNFKCDQCPKSFKAYGDLKQHQFYHREFEEKDLHECDLCEKKYKKKYQLNVHKLSHTGIQFKCSFASCDKSYTSKNTLSRHELTHTTGTKYICGVCGRQFLRKLNLEGHERSHKNERPFGCKLCDKSFTLQDYLSKHINAFHVSEEERRYVCEICGNKFKLRQHLRQHESTHTGIPAYDYMKKSRSSKPASGTKKKSRTKKRTKSELEIEEEMLEENDTLEREKETEGNEDSKIENIQTRGSMRLREKKRKKIVFEGYEDDTDEENEKETDRKEETRSEKFQTSLDKRLNSQKRKKRGTEVDADWEATE